MNKSLFSRTAISRRQLLEVAGAAATTALMPVAATATTAQPASSGGGIDLERFVADCVAANMETDGQAAVSEVLMRAVRSSKSVLAALGEPKRAGLRVLHKSPTLTIFSATWTPQMNLMPHNHLMWASIGIYTGREDNIMWRRTPDNIEAFRAEALFAGDVGILPADVIHSVTNPLLRFTGGIHVYGGDFFNTPRSEWNPENLDERPSDGESIRAMFARENERNQLSK